MKQAFLILSFLILVSIPGSILAQQHIYRVKWKGDSIGYLIAEQKRSGSLTTFELKSRTQFSMLLSFDMYTEYYAVYRDGQLLSATSENILNDKRKSHSTVKWLENKYIITVDDEKHHESSEITESISTLYFFPPANGRIFSERHGIFCEIRRESPKMITLVKPDERLNHYYYDDKGVCTRAEVNLALATIQLEMIN